MAYTLLQVLNKVLRRESILQGDAGELTALTSTAFQTDIDCALGAINDVVDELYGDSGRPQQRNSSTLTLVAGTREYDLASDCESVIPPLVNQSSGYFLLEYPGGYDRMKSDQLQPANYTGRPLYFCINPVNGKARMDRTPTAAEAGEAYAYDYLKRTNLSTATDTFPFSDEVNDNLIQAYCQAYKLDRKPATYSQALFNAAMARGARLISKVRAPGMYGVARAR
jgi:hypothetical protein